MKSVGAFEAKTHFGEFLNSVSRGETIQITRRGIPVARLVPADESTPKNLKPRDLKKIVREIREIRQGAHLGEITIRELIHPRNRR